MIDYFDGENSNEEALYGGGTKTQQRLHFWQKISRLV
jgi:hypothetical protein